MAALAHVNSLRHAHFYLRMKGSSFLNQQREVIRTNQFSYGSEKTYITWIYRLIILHDKIHPKEMDGNEIADYPNLPCS